MEYNHTRKRLLIGVIIILIGGALLFKNFGFFDDFIDNYIFRWEMILICLGLIGIFANENQGPGFILLLIGGALYFKHEIGSFLPHNINFWQLFMAGLLILVGIAIIFKRKVGPHHRCEKKSRDNSIDDENMFDEVAVFGGGDRVISSQNFKGGKILAIFGGSNFNMTRAKLAPGKNYIDVFVIFGGMKFVVPEDWNIKIEVVSIFGGMSDKHRMHLTESTEPEDGQLIIKGFVLFGGGEIKSF